MTTHRTKLPGWTRRDFVSAGLATAGAVTLGACAHVGTPWGSAATSSAADLDDLAQRIHGRFLTRGSRGYDGARKIGNLPYARPPPARARGAALGAGRRCGEFARRHAVPVAIRGGGHSYAGFGVPPPADGDGN